MDHVICTICNWDWGISKYKENINSYICPVCAWKMKRNKKIKIGDEKKK